jgi:hypothetical protein
MQTVQLAKLTGGQVTAVDLYPQYLNQLQQLAAAEGVSDRITVVQADMADLPFEPESFDLIWAEGSAYIMGFGNALSKWRSLLKEPGYLVASEVTWIRSDPPAAVIDFWREEYPDLQDVEANLSLTKTHGYLPIAHYLLPTAAWWDDYYTPLEERVHLLRPQYASDPDALKVLDLHQLEMDLSRRYSDYYGYVFYILAVDQLKHPDMLPLAAS